MFEWKVTFDNLLMFVSLLIVAWQIRDGNRQRKIESQIELQAVTRELVSLGFSKPELFKILQDHKDVDPNVEMFYLQLWLNQFCQFDALNRSDSLKKDVRESLEIDFRDLLGMQNMRRHWEKFGKFYPASFQEKVNNILNETGHNLAGENAETVTR